MTDKCYWIKISPGLSKGINLINEFDDSKFEQFLRRIVAKVKAQDAEIFTEEERSKLQKIFKKDDESLVMAIKTILHLFKKLLKYIFMPQDLKNDLKKIGLSNEKAEFVVKVWSSDTRGTLNELGSKEVEAGGDKLNFSWKLNAELSSEYRKKYKLPKAYLSIGDGSEIELTHPELYSVFLQFESIQNELDNLM